MRLSMLAQLKLYYIKFLQVGLLLLQTKHSAHAPQFQPWLFDLRVAKEASNS